MSDELRVAWMIDGFDTDDDLHQLWMVGVNVFDQLGLGISWSGDQHRAGVCDRLGDRFEEILILGGMSGADRIRLVVDVPGRIVGPHHQPVDVGRAEMEHTRFVVIDPNDGVKVMGRHETRPFAARTHLTRTDFAIKPW